MSDLPPSSAQHHHRREAASVPTVVVSVSDTRTLETDSAGQRVAELLTGAGHPVLEREIVKDDAAAIAGACRRAIEREGVRAVILTGGTGVAPRDLTPDAVEPLLDRVVPGFGELFRMLSFEEIGSAALLSRALCGIAQGVVVFVLPGSRGAVTLALTRLVLPELSHLGRGSHRPGRS